MKKKTTRPNSTSFSFAARSHLGWIALLETGGVLVDTVLPVPTRRRALALLGVDGPLPEKQTPLLGRAADHLIRYFESEPRRETPAVFLASIGEGFFGRVYRELAKVPAGKVVTYGELAARAGPPAASRAVGQAMASNRLAPLVPCHRVVRGDGSLGGYSAEGGPSLKRLLLEWEGVTFDGAGRVIR